MSFLSVLQPGICHQAFAILEPCLILQCSDASPYIAERHLACTRLDTATRCVGKQRRKHSWVKQQAYKADLLGCR